MAIRILSQAGAMDVQLWRYDVAQRRRYPVKQGAGAFDACVGNQQPSDARKDDKG